MLEPASADAQAELLRLAGPAFARRQRLGPRDRSVHILPGVPADAPDVLRFKGAVADALLARLPRSATQDGVYTGSGLSGEWQRARNVTGYLMDPAGSPTGAQPADVPKRYASEADRELYRFVARELTRHVVPAAFTVKKMASSGHPAYSKNMEDKLAGLLAGARALQTAEGRAALRAKNLRALAADGVYLASTKASRSQPDRVWWDPKARRWMSKDRSVTNWHQQRVVADKSLDLGGRLPRVREQLGKLADSHVRQRARVAYAISWPINAANLTAAAGVRSGMYRMFPRTVHFRDPASQEQQLDPGKPFAITFDVTNFDQNQPLFMILDFVDALPLIEEAKIALRLLVQCPVFINSDVMGERGGIWLGNPLDAGTFTARHGNISGWVWNDILNAVVGIFLALLAAREVGLWRQEGAWRDVVLAILRWEHPVVGINNKGDDTVLWVADAGVRAKLDAFFRRPGRPAYFEVALEDGAQFLGNIFVREGGRIRLLPNLASYTNNLLVTEYSAGSANRPYASFGYFQRQSYYGIHPTFGEVDAIVEEQSKLHLGERLSEIADRTLVMPRSEEGLLNYAAQLFIWNPSAIHYKLDPATLPRGLFEQFFFSIEAERAWPLLAKPVLDSTAYTELPAQEVSHD